MPPSLRPRPRHLAWLAAGLVLLAAGLTLAIVASWERPPAPPQSAPPAPPPTRFPSAFPVEQIRSMLSESLQPVTLANCEMQRFGEERDGGYLLCANLLGGVRAGYSYGISGYDGWGCQVATASTRASRPAPAGPPSTPSAWGPRPR
jgi:hypothetical protein